MSYEGIVDFIKTYEVDGDFPYMLALSSTAVNDAPFEVDYVDLYDNYPAFAKEIKDNPEKIIEKSGWDIRTAAKQLNPERYEDDLTPITLRIKNYLGTHQIRTLGHKLIEQLTSIEGIITQMGVPYPEMVEICYKCLHCAAEVTMSQNSQFTRKPDQCPSYAPRDGCKNKKDFEIVPKKTKYREVQIGVMEENADDVSPGLLPKKFKIELDEALCDTVAAGSRVRLTGWIKGKLFKKNDNNPVIDLYFHVNNVEYLDIVDNHVEFNDDDVEQFHELIKREDYVEYLIKSVAPVLQGLDEIKLFLALQQVGGVEKRIGEEVKRGSIHGELAGDPSEGKSVLLTWASRLNNRGVSVTGGGASGVGLTASVNRNETTGDWMLQAGAFVLADRGHVSIDEIEKMRNEDREHIHPAMEQQIIAVNKAGINAQLYTRCSVLGASNPKDGKWKPELGIEGNVSNLPPALLSRFDCIFILINDRTLEEELERASFIINLHKNQDIGDVISEAFLKKFFTYAKMLKPRITDDVTDRLKELYGTLYSASKQMPDSIMVTPRQLEGLIRLSEASAKLHLREETTMSDAEIAIRVLRASLLQSAVDNETDNIDLKSLYGTKPTKGDRLKSVPVIVERLMNQSVDQTRVSRVVFIEYAHKTWKITEAQAGKFLENAIKDGSVYCPTPATLAVSQ